MNHPLFKKVRNESREKVAENPVIFDFEKEGELSAKRIEKLFINEIKFYKKKK